MFMQLVMTSVAVLKVDDLGRRPLLIGGVSGIVCILFTHKKLNLCCFSYLLETYLQFCYLVKRSFKSTLSLYTTGPFVTSPLSLLQISGRLSSCCSCCFTSLCWMLPGIHYLVDSPFIHSFNLVYLQKYVRESRFPGTSLEA